MSNFYNPYMKGPDVGQGMQDILSQFIQMMLIKKMFPGQQQAPQQPITEPGTNLLGGLQFPAKTPSSPFDPATMQRLLSMMNMGMMRR